MGSAATALGDSRDPDRGELRQFLRIVQVLENLLANAARHSPETSPIRVAAARIRAVGGGPGRGTRVAFTLPVAEAEPGASASGSPPARQDRQRTPILVVDDDPNSLRQVRGALAAAGYAPVVTAEPGDVPRLVETRRPRLLLLDLVLPGTDGIALMETLPALAGLPVTFISAYGCGDTVANALEAGAADYIVKPFSPAELVARIKVALRRRTGPGRESFLLGGLAIDYEKCRVTVAGRPVRLTATEYGLLRARSLDAGGVTTYDSLLR